MWLEVHHYFNEPKYFKSNNLKIEDGFQSILKNTVGCKASWRTPD
jgi:hypothetical protein